MSLRLVSKTDGRSFGGGDGINTMGLFLIFISFYGLLWRRRLGIHSLVETYTFYSSLFYSWVKINLALYMIVIES